jgi:long-subunit fatty acid transport protein
MRILIAAVMLWPVAALAGAYAIPNENARDLALAQSAVAAQTGPEAVMANTAALAGQRGFAVSGSLEMIANKTSWSDASLGRATTKDHPNFPPALAVSYGDRLPNGMAWGAGVGLMLPAGGSLFWPDGWAGAERIQSVDERTYVGRAGAGIELLPGVKLGAALVYYRITEKLVQTVNYVDHTGPATLGLSGGAFSFALSTELKLPAIPVTVGVDYRHKGDLELTGKAHFDDVPPTYQSQLQDQGATEHVTAPNELFVGVAVQATPELRITGSWNLERWKVYRADAFIGDKGFSVTVPRSYNNAWVYRLGAEYANVPGAPALTLRAGIGRSISEQPSDTVSPTLSDGNSWFGAVGAGYQVLPALRVDVAYQYAWFDKVKASGADAFPGSYDTHAHLVSLGATWRSW